MTTELTIEVEQLVEWRIGILGLNTTPKDVSDSFKKGTLNNGELKASQNALRSFRKRSDDAKLAIIERVLKRMRQAAPQTPSETVIAEPATSDPGTPLASVAPQEPQGQTEISPTHSAALAELMRKTTLEMKEEQGEVYISLRCFEKLVGKRPDNLRRNLEARRFPIREILLPNERGELRHTPAINVIFIFAVVCLADLHGLDTEERERLFALQREMPDWMRKFYAPPKTSSRSSMYDLVESIPSALNALGNRVLSAIASGFSKLDERLSSKFETIERLFRERQGEAPLPPKRPVIIDPTTVATRSTTVLDGSKLNIHTPVKNIYDVVNEINKHLGYSYSFTAEDIILMAEQAGIYERNPWGMFRTDQPVIVLPGGVSITWWFDIDSLDLLKSLARKETITRGNATPS